MKVYTLKSGALMLVPDGALVCFVTPGTEEQGARLEDELRRLRSLADMLELAGEHAKKTLWAQNKLAPET